MNNGHILTPQQAAQAQPVLNVAQPLNDVQLVALVAAQVYAGGAAFDAEQYAVAAAVEIVARSVAAVGSGLLRDRLAELHRAATENN